MAAILRGKVFDYRALRLLMGVIALSMPFVVRALAGESLSSISASYYTAARDAFVGMLFVVGAFLWAYNGHTPSEATASKVAALAALCVAVFPTTCSDCQVTLVSWVHYIAAVVLFSILAYFCLGPFRERTKGQPGKKGRRAKIYFICGWVMVLCMVAAVLAKLVLSPELMDRLEITFWAEATALVAFGVAWITAGKFIPPLVDESEALRLFG